MVKDHIIDSAEFFIVHAVDFGATQVVHFLCKTVLAKNAIVRHNLLLCLWNSVPQKLGCRADGGESRNRELLECEKPAQSAARPTTRRAACFGSRRIVVLSARA